MRDPETGNSKGYAFINYASFDASDAAIEAMNGQYLCNRPISISYAFKKDSKGERHGSAAGNLPRLIFPPTDRANFRFHTHSGLISERLLAAQNPLSQADRPHQLFADAPPLPPAQGNMQAPMAGPPPMMMAGMPQQGQPPMPPLGMPPPGNFSVFTISTSRHFLCD